MAEKAKKTPLGALAGPVNMGVVSAATIGAFALHSWPIFALGGVAYAALVAWDMVGVAPKSDSVAPELLDPALLTDPTARAAMQTIRAARAELDAVLKDTPVDVQVSLVSTLSSVDELEQTATALAKRADDLARYLSTRDPRVVAQDIETIALRIARTTDPEARKQLQSAHTARVDHLKVLGDLETAVQRIDASLLSIASTLEALPAKVVRMKALDAHAMDEISGSVQKDLSQMNGEIRSLEEVLESLAVVDAASAVSGTTPATTKV